MGKATADGRLGAVVAIVVSVITLAGTLAVGFYGKDAGEDPPPPRDSVNIVINNRVLAGIGPDLQDDELPVPVMPTPRKWQQSEALLFVDSGDVLLAECFSYGVRLTDGNDAISADDRWSFDSRLVYGVTLDDGRRGYVHSVWSTKREDTLGLRRC